MNIANHMSHKQASHVTSSDVDGEDAFDLQLEKDNDQLGLVVAGIQRLEDEWHDARALIGARQRGYFTPDEDDWARRMLTTYIDYRQTLYEILFRYRHYQEITDPERQLRVFLVALGAALTLLSKSLKLIQSYEHEPLVRAKLNEPDARYGLEPGFFEEILSAYTSLANYRKFARGLWFWRKHRRRIQELVERGSDEWRWLVEMIRTEREVVQRRLGSVMWKRLCYDWAAFWRMMFAPVEKARYCLQSVIATVCSRIRVTLNYQPGLTHDVLHSLRDVLLPGDVLLVRAERKLTSMFLPSFWSHSALFIGGEKELSSFDLLNHPHCSGHLGMVQRQAFGLGSVIEAITPSVLINSLEKSLHADHVVVLRPSLSQSELREALAEAFSHLGKPYDYEFDFNVTSRLVCTEIIYRIFHNRGGIRFPLVRRLGRYTLTGDDIARFVIKSLAEAETPAKAPFRIVSLAIKDGERESRLIPESEAVETLQHLLEGWRPAKFSESARRCGASGEQVMNRMARTI